MQTKMKTKGVLLSQTQLLHGITWRGRRDLNPRLPSNISDLSPKPVRTIAYKLRTNLIVTIRYTVTVTIAQKGENGRAFPNGQYE